MHLLESADVESMIKLLSTAGDPTVAMPLTVRKRQLLEGLGAIVAADAWLWVVSRMNFEVRGDSMALSAVDGGWLDEQERAKTLGVVVHPDLVPIVTAPLHDAMLQQRSITRSRDQVMDDEAWYATKAGKAWRAAGFDHFIISAYPVGGGIISCAGFYRRYGRPAFEERHRTISHIMWQQIDWLHRSESDVPASEHVLRLTPRERQATLLLLGGDSRKQVAAKMNLSEHTVADYLKEIYRKFNVSSRAELLSKFIPGGK